MDIRTRIVVRRVKNDPTKEHYGGMWKVAYADFVTAMMAFFMLLWIVGATPKKNLKGLAEYFSPSNMADTAEIHKDQDASIIESDNIGMLSDTDKQNFISIMSSIQQTSVFEEFSNHLSLDITNEGLRIQIMDNDNRPMFNPGTNRLEPYMKTILRTIGSIVKDLPNYVSVAGHTASIRDLSSTNVDLWELSISRANIVRQFLCDGIFNNDKIVRIVGKADKEPFDYKNPYSLKNIRIAIILLNKSEISDHQRPFTGRLFHGK